MHPAYNLIKNPKIGSIVPVVEVLPYALQPVEYFAKLSDYGNKKHSILFESADIVPKYGEKSLGSADPCLKVIGQKEHFEIIALNDLGVRFIRFLKNDFNFCDEVENKKYSINDPDYIFYFLDNLFLIDHKENKTFFVANALITDDINNAYEECISKIEYYKKSINKNIEKPKSYSKSKYRIETDTSREEFIELVRKIKQHIISGDVYQTVISRTISLDFNKEPIEVYKKLRELNPSPYMFYIKNDDGVLLGSSPEMSLRVQGDEKKIAEIRPIAGTKPRGLVGNKIDADLDSRYETELKIDAKEISEHIMLVDLARNDVAKISEPGTRYVDEPFIVEKYSHVQHLVSNVKGTLKHNLDALHAYVATMNMGTLTGAPKVEAMKLIRIYEKTKRGFYGGAVGYITPSGDLDSTIVIRSIRIKGNKAYVRAGAGIVYDSDPESEFVETERKAYACLKAIELAGG